MNAKELRKKLTEAIKAGAGDYIMWAEGCDCVNEVKDIKIAEKSKTVMIEIS